MRHGMTGMIAAPVLRSLSPWRSVSQMCLKDCVSDRTRSELEVESNSPVILAARSPCLSALLLISLPIVRLRTAATPDVGE